MQIYRCAKCGRNGRAFAFWWLKGGIVSGKPSVWCPACKIPGTIVDQDGIAADPLNPPDDARVKCVRWGENHRISNRALRGGVSGRRMHGQIIGG